MKTIRLRVIDGKMAARTGDALLSCPSDSEWREYCASVARGVDLGQVWNGVEASLDALDDDKRTMIYDRLDARRELEAGKRKKATGALDGTTQDFDPLGRHESAKLGQEINARNRAAWGQGHVRGRGVTR
jgi:hypothetical protein